MAAPIIYQPGERFGRFTIIEKARGKYPGTHWRCRCDCGTEKTVYGRELRNGRTVSCGCYHREERGRAKTTHGDSKRSGWAPEYHAWIDMRKRCNDPRSKWYRDYGGRGIAVCEQWRSSYETFLADMGRRPTSTHSIDRVNNDGHYEPQNCRWATRSQQQQNKRSPRPYVRAHAS